MASEWPKVRVEEIAERVAVGPFGSSIKVETFVPEGVPVISGQHLNGWCLDDSVGYNFITPEHADRLKNANVQRGDVIFTHAGNIGQVAYIPTSSKYERYVISQRQFYLRPDPSKVLPEFIVAYFKTPEGQHKLLANQSQVGVPSIAQPVTYLRTIEIPLPPLPEQRAIAHILGTLDDKIELNRRMSQTLEQMARALFKAWFVDFEPVRAKMNLPSPSGSGPGVRAEVRPKAQPNNPLPPGEGSGVRAKNPLSPPSLWIAPVSYENAPPMQNSCSGSFCVIGRSRELNFGGNTQSRRTSSTFTATSTV
jgi:restriction endonuclease S subunit